MTKKELMQKWGDLSSPLKNDIQAVIATEIMKALEPQPSDKVQISKHTLVEVNRAFRALKQDRNSYIHKVFSDDGVFDAMNEISEAYKYYFGEQPQEKPALNPIEEAYERGEKIRQKNWLKDAWIQKLSETESTSDTLTTFSNNWDFATHPENWELYTEPNEQPAKPFDRDRFEAMFRAVVASGVKQDFEFCKRETTYFIQKLDSYYATKEGGDNG